MWGMNGSHHQPYDERMRYVLQAYIYIHDTDIYTPGYLSKNIRLLFFKCRENEHSTSVEVLQESGMFY